MKKRINTQSLILFSLTSILVGCFYLLTATTRLTFANYANDSGDFLTAILTAGIPHPTGYPTYMLLGLVLQKLPIGSEFFRAILVSLLPAAIGAGLLAALLRRFFLTSDHWSSFVFSFSSGVLWGLSTFLWSQAVIIEVHGLQSLFIVLALWWILELLDEKTRASGASLPVLSFLFGLGLGNHITLSFFLPAIVLASVSAFRAGLPKKTLISQLLFLLLGLLVYCYLPIRAAQMPPINWGNAATWEGFWWLVSGKVYHNLVFDITFEKIISRIFAFAYFLRQQFGIIGIILAVVGLFQHEFKSRWTRAILLYLFFVYAAFAITYGTDDSVVYLLPSILVFAILIGLSLSFLFPWRRKSIPLGQILIALCAVLFLVSIPQTFRNVDVRSNTSPADFAESALAKLPQNAILTTSSDPDSFPLWYYHYGLGLRPDLTIFTLPLTQFRWYQETLIHTYPKIRFPTPIQAMANKNQNWGEQVAALNPTLPHCNSLVLRAETTQIQISCSTGEVYNFIVN
jgi:hypothetical protein